MLWLLYSWCNGRIFKHLKSKDRDKRDLGGRRSTAAI